MPQQTDMIRSLLLFIIALGATEECSTLARAQTPVRFECQGGVTVTAKFVQPEGRRGTVILTMQPSRYRLVLRQALSADGGRYVGPNVQFWIKGKTATLTRRRETSACRVTLVHQVIRPAGKRP